MQTKNDSKKKDQLSIPMEMVQWWERKRLIYNIIIIPITILVLWSLWEYVGRFISPKQVIIDAFWVIVWCNVLYTSGWVGGILRHYYFRSYALPIAGRWILFCLGTLFTLIVTNVHFSLLINPILGG